MTRRNVSILTGLERPVQQPRHSGRQKNLPRFQSSPALKDRCNVAQAELELEAGPVSILTGLERPVQRERGHRLAREVFSFNPHRP